MELHRCAKCNGTFWTDEMSPNGKQKPTYCKMCKNQIVREHVEANPEQNHERYLRYYAKHKADIIVRVSSRSSYKTNAYRVVYNAKLNKQPCEVCGDPNTIAHHNDYDKPLEVRWLCSRCHNRLHFQGDERIAKTIC